MLKTKFRGAQLEMLMGARLVVAACRLYMVQFAAYKGKYTEAFLDALLAQIKAAELMPDLQTRGAESERSREELKVLNRQALGYMQDLKGYILEVYAEYQQKSMLEAAGATYIERGNQLNWDATRGMLVAMGNFMVLHQARLEANGANMPPSFLPKVQALRAEYDSLYEYFLSSREMATIGTEEKVEACNEVYEQIIVICDDGKKMFRERDGVRSLFVWDDILLKVAGPGTQGLKGYVVDAATTRGIIGAELYLVEADVTLLTNEEGRFQVLQLAAGEYTVKVSAEYYANKTAKMSIQTGTVSSFTVELESLEEGELEE